MTVINNQEKSESFWALYYNVICVILKFHLGGLNHWISPPLWDIGLTMTNYTCNCHHGWRTQAVLTDIRLSSLPMISANHLSMHPQLKCMAHSGRGGFYRKVPCITITSLFSTFPQTWFMNMKILILSNNLFLAAWTNTGPWSIYPVSIDTHEAYVAWSALWQYGNSGIMV